MSNASIEQYASGVRALFARTASTDRGAAVANTEALLPRAEELAARSESLNLELAGDLNGQDPAQRVAAATRLLAKSMTDLELSAYLQEAADRGAGLSDRSVQAAPNVEAYLKLLTEDVEAGYQADRSGGTIADLATSVEDDMSIVAKRAADTAKTAFQKLATIGLGQLAQAAGSIGTSVASFLGVSDTVTRLYKVCRQFIASAYQAVVTLIGDKLAQLAGEQVVGWIKDHTSADSFSSWLKQQYAVDTICTELRKEIEAKPPKSSDGCRQKIDWLVEQHRKQMDLVSKLIKAMDYLRLLPVAATPPGAAVFAGAYLMICGYAVFAGADYLDAPHLQFFSRVVGIPAIVRQAL